MSTPVSDAINHFADRFAPHWSRQFSIDVLRDTRKACRSLAEYQRITGLGWEEAHTLWVAGRPDMAMTA